MIHLIQCLELQNGLQVNQVCLHKNIVAIHPIRVLIFQPQQMADIGIPKAISIAK